MTLKRGSLEILQAVQEEAKSFSDLEGMEIGGKSLSSATVDKRLKELSAIDAIEEKEIRTDSGRKTTGYVITSRGEKMVEIGEEYREKVEDID